MEVRSVCLHRQTSQEERLQKALDHKNFCCLLRCNGMNYSTFMNGLKKAGITLNRKMLSEIAINDAAGFTALTEKARQRFKGANISRSVPGREIFRYVGGFAPLIITSRKNDAVRRFRDILREKKLRDSEGVFAVEGDHLCGELAKSGFRIISALATRKRDLKISADRSGASQRRGVRCEHPRKSRNIFRIRRLRRGCSPSRRSRSTPEFRTVPGGWCCSTESRIPGTSGRYCAPRRLSDLTGRRFLMTAPMSGRRKSAPRFDGSASRAPVYYRGASGDNNRAERAWIHGLRFNAGQLCRKARDA